LMAHGVADLNVGSVQRADRQRSIHGEFHIACARGLLARCGDLFGKIGGGIDALAVFDIEVRHKDHLEDLRNCWSLFEDFGDGVDQLDDQFGHAVSGGGFAAEDHGARRYARIETALELAIKSDRIQRVQVLALVLVQPFHLDIEERLRIDNDAGAFLDKAGQGALVVGFDRLPLSLKTGIDGKGLDAFKLFLQSGYPSIADLAGNQRAQLRIAQHDPAPRRNAIGHIRKLFRHYGVEVAQHVLFEQLAMERRDAIDRVAADAGEMRHAHIPFSGFIDQRQAPEYFVVAWITRAHAVEEVAIDLVDDLQVARQELAKK